MCCGADVWAIKNTEDDSITRYSYSGVYVVWVSTDALNL